MIPAVCAGIVASLPVSEFVTNKPASLALKVHCGAPKVQLVGIAPPTPKTTLPGVLTCTFLVTELAPTGITKPLPDAPPEVPSQATVGAPLAVRLPLTPPV